MEEKTVTIPRTTIWIATAALLVGFVAGSEWQAYRTREAARAALSDVQNALTGLGLETSEPQAAAGANVSGSTDHWTITGTGNAESEQFSLSGGNYATSWNTDCNDMVTMATILSSSYAMDVLSGSRGATHEADVPAGDYAVSMIVESGCTWSVQIDAA